MGGVHLVLEEFDVLLVEMRQRAEFGIRLANLEAIGLYCKEMVVNIHRFVDLQSVRLRPRGGT